MIRGLSRLGAAKQTGLITTHPVLKILAIPRAAKWNHVLDGHWPLLFACRMQQQPQQPRARRTRWARPPPPWMLPAAPQSPLPAAQELLCDQSLSNIDILTELERVESDEAARTKLLSSEAARDALAARLTQVGSKNTAQPWHSNYPAPLKCCRLAQLLGSAAGCVCVCPCRRGARSVWPLLLPRMQQRSRTCCRRTSMR